MARLADWSAAREHIRATYQVAQDGATWLGLVWSFAAEPEPIEQTVEVTEIEGDGARWVRVLASVARRNDIDVAAALRYNFLLVEGRLALFDDLLVFFHCVRLPAADASELDRALALASQEGARLRGTFAPGAARPPFTNYAE